MFEFQTIVEVVFHSALSTAGNKDYFVDSDRCRLFDCMLNECLSTTGSISLYMALESERNELSNPLARDAAFIILL